MNQPHRSLRSCALGLALLSCHAFGREAAAQTAAPRPATNTQVAVKYRPPTKAAPSVRVTGGSRGTGGAAIRIDVLAPDDVGLTTQAQPSLFWYQSQPADAKFELTLLQEKKVKPLLQFNESRAAKAGIQRLNLSDHGVTLTPGVEYEWVVALINDPDNRSKDLVASGVIQRVAPAPELQDRVSKASPDALPALFAEAGIWHDALSALSDRIEASPGDPALRQARADLLQQVGLKSAAEAEISVARKQSSPP